MVENIVRFTEKLLRNENFKVTWGRESEEVQFSQVI